MKLSLEMSSGTAYFLSGIGVGVCVTAFAVKWDAVAWLALLFAFLIGVMAKK